MRLSPSFLLFALSSLLPALLCAATAVAPREQAETTTTDILGPDDILIAGMVTIFIGAVSAIITKHIADHSHEDRAPIPGQYVAASNAHSALTQMLNDIHNRDRSIRLLAVKAFVPVTGHETLGVPGQDWGALWIPVQTSSTTAKMFVVWWSKRRGGTLTIHNPPSGEWVVSSDVQLTHMSGSYQVHL
ncbi:hypothetical protein EYR40_010630 [Pleurotus pulmonarius]|nr:hypothetical protein EYR36_002404 [Pleurotus pulmonarius]KAF4586618.1 hypothetical protein EYR40_010630 [Pleurotus pulmonarius]